MNVDVFVVLMQVVALIALGVGAGLQMWSDKHHD